MTDETIFTHCVHIHKELGSNEAEAIYHSALLHALRLDGLVVDTEYKVFKTYRGVRIRERRLDIVIPARSVLIELKHVDDLLPEHYNQVAEYMALSGLSTAYLINFQRGGGGDFPDYAYDEIEGFVRKNLGGLTIVRIEENIENKVRRREILYDTAVKKTPPSGRSLKGAT